jgi:hypothetical protein
MHGDYKVKKDFGVYRQTITTVISFLTRAWYNAATDIQYKITFMTVNVERRYKFN